MDEWIWINNSSFWSSFHFMCEIRSPGNLKHLDAVFILNTLIKYQRLSELDVDNMLEKAIYGAGFIN